MRRFASSCPPGGHSTFPRLPRSGSFIYRFAREDEAESSLLKKLIASRLDYCLPSGGEKIVREPVRFAKEEPLTLELEAMSMCPRPA